MTEPIRQIERAQEGHWRLRMTKGGPLVAACIKRVQTVCEPGNESNAMERSPFLAAFIDGESVAMERVWHYRGDPITEAEHDFMVAEAAWCRANAPEEPAAQPTRRVDLSRLPVPF